MVQDDVGHCPASTRFWGTQRWGSSWDLKIHVDLVLKDGENFERIRKGKDILGGGEEPAGAEAEWGRGHLGVESSRCQLLAICTP